MAIAIGRTAFDPFKRNQPAPTGNIFSPQRAYPAAIEQQAGDYDDIMGRYRQLADAPRTDSPLSKAYSSMAGSTPFQFQSYNPIQHNYTPTQDVTSSLSNLQNLSQTGGYSEGDISNIRERAISPIRSIYAGAQRNLDRQRSLSGGYSPSYNAAVTRMAREQSEQIGGAMTGANAQIAQMVAQGRQTAAPQYAGYAGQESGLREGINASNVAAQNRAQEMNISNRLAVDQANRAARQEGLGGLERLQQDQMQALQGMQSLYGTTPALASVYGNQALAAEQMAPPIRRRQSSGFAGGRPASFFSGY